MSGYLLSATQYAKQKGISKMQVIRQIRSGLISAQKVGNNWLIFAEATSNQTNLTKTTSLQVWAKLVKLHLGKQLDIERSKDREIIYSRINSLGLPHQRSLSIPQGNFPTLAEFTSLVKRLGFPYWISAVPDPSIGYLDRQSKLDLSDINSGWEFINSLSESDKYKINVSQYGQNVLFGGTLLISKTGHGLAEFVTGDRHYLMTRGFTLTDPLLFNSKGISKYSNTIINTYQDELFNLTKGLSGHFEFSYGTLDHHPQLYFFDYSQDHPYTTDIDPIWKPSLATNGHGLPCSPGLVTGPCLVVHHQDFSIFKPTDSKYVLISDTLTPEMVPLLKSAQAVVLDLGGVTSHPSIVLRELGIPTIVGAIDATNHFITGQKVKVNTTLGKISK